MYINLFILNLPLLTQQLNVTTNSNNSSNPLDNDKGAEDDVDDGDVKEDLKLEINKSNPNGFRCVLVVIVVLKKTK